MTSPNIRVIDDSNFEKEVLASERPFLLDFTATWCGPCRALAPLLDRIADQHVGELTIGKLDIDAAPATTIRYAVRGAPTLILFVGGREVSRQIGLTSRDAILKLVGRCVATHASAEAR